MKRISSLLLLVLICCKSLAQQDTVEAKIILIGDAGDLKNGRHPVISAVKGKYKFDKKTTIIYLGDNLYTTGLPDQQSSLYDMRRATLDSQVSIADGTPAKVYFIPGNHDWDRAGADGWSAILREQEYINLLSNNNVRFFPEGGCGGPVEISVSPEVTLMIFDSQWWIHPFNKPGIESDCPFKTKTEILAQMEDILQRNSKKLVILACHHPFKSYGPHGGNYNLKQHIFPLTEMFPKLYIPLPVIGSIYPIARGVFGTPQDLRHPAYANMITDVEAVAKKHPNLIFVSGHEHNLQLIKDSSYNYIISGSGTKSTRVSPNKKNVPFATSANGFAVLEVSTRKNVNVSFYTVGKDSTENPYKEKLLNFASMNNAADSTKPDILPVATAFKDSVLVEANKKYGRATGMKKIVLGNNYRKEWTTPVHLKVFNINKEKGGLVIESFGGGKQTKSLRLVDKKGKEWVLRTITKDPEKAIPENLRGTVAEDIVQDMISAAHPYAPLIVPPLAKAIGVVAASPEFFYVPDDYAFGRYRDIFKNTICMLELREPTPNGAGTKSTANIIKQLIDDNDNHVDQEAVLNARLLDMLLGDWDRHFDQWRFGTGDTGKGKLYYPIPRDRDQALFNSDGMLVKQMSENVLPFLSGFRQNFHKVEWLGWEARDFDRLFMNNLDAAKWRKQLYAFQQSLTNAVIENAVKKMPPEIFAIRGKQIIETLKSRRDKLVKSEAMRYYNYLAKEVNVVGSNKREYFKVTDSDSGVHVLVYKIKANNDTASVLFNRTFNEKQTKTIYFYGLNGNDFFDIAPNVASKIKLRIIGGRGMDTFDVKGKIENVLYDFNNDTSEQNIIVYPKNSKNQMSGDPLVNRYDVVGHKYNIYRYPRINIGLNPEDKLLFGVGWLRRTYGFRNEPYSSQQRVSTLYAPASGSYQLKYNGEFNHLYKNSDLIVNAQIVHPTLDNFYGLGNDTKRINNREFYRVRYNYIEGDVLLRKRVVEIVSLYAGPTVYNYWLRPEDNRGKVLNQPSTLGLDSAGVYQTKTYLGARAGILIDNLNSDLLPTRGIYWNTTLTNVYGMNQASKNLLKLTTDLTLYSSLNQPAKLVAVLRAGGGHIYGKENDFEYFQALNLGANNYLRGYRKNRFSGSSMFYQSTELRVKLFESQSYILPGAVGVIGFNDVGKVWLKNQTSKKWHHSYGGGVYYTPYNLILISATVGVSPEDVLFNLSIGTRFNLTF